MAHFTVQGALKQLFNGDNRVVMLFGLETKDPFHCKSGCGRLTIRNFFIPIHFHKMNGSSRIFSCSSLGRGRGRGKKSNSSNAEEQQRLGDDATTTTNDDDEIIDEVGEFENDDQLSCFRGLVLDISYRPVNVVCWKRAICLEFMEKVALWIYGFMNHIQKIFRFLDPMQTENADVLEYYDQTVNSPSGSYYIPAVLRVPQLLQVVKRRRIKQCLSRKNIFYRDAFTCQYCSSRENLTIDHVLPIARGGGWNWENLVTACVKCNSKKGPKSLEEANMKLNKVPKTPKEFDILSIPLTTAAMNMLRKKKTMPEEWRQYLSMDSKSSTSEP